MSDQDIIDTALTEAQKIEAEFIREYGAVKDDGDFWNLILGFSLIMILGSKFLRRRSYTLPTNLINKLPPRLKELLNKGSFVVTKETRKTLVEMFGQYKGVRSAIKNLRGEDIAKLIKEAKKAQKDVLENNIKQNGIASLAEIKGFKYVTAKTRSDARVRPSHKKNNGRIWLLKSYQPWLDFNCRCTYTFSSTKDFK